MLTGVKVIGDLQLSARNTVRWPLVCRMCLFEGGIRGARCDLRRHLRPLRHDRSRPCRLRAGDVQRAGALRHAAGAACATDGVRGPPATFELARFGQLVSFERASFGKGANFTLARFAADATFESAAFGSDDAAAPAVFTRAAFGAPADFRAVMFHGRADFAEARFAQRVDFSQTSYDRTAYFRDDRFAGDADYRFASFGFHDIPSRPYSATFEFATSAGSFDFGSTVFQGKATFNNMTSSGAISFADAILRPGLDLVMTGMEAMNLFIAVPAVLQSVQPVDRKPVLALLERTAQARDDLGVANDALYARRVLISRGYALPARVADAVLYRTVAGYLVRPFRPLAALALLAAVVTLARLAPWRARPARPLGARQVGQAAGGYLHGYLDTLALVVPGHPTPEARRLEVLAYRILFVCALVGFANSNPTLRQMFDALH